MKNRLRKQNKDGSALIYVMCVLCIFMALILSMTLAAYQVLSHAQRAATKEQCKLSAVTANAIIEQQMTEETEETGQNALQSRLAKAISDGTWPYYNEEEHTDKAAARKYFSVELPDAQKNMVGDITVTAYWESDQESVDKKDYSDITLVLKTTCTLRKQSYSVTTQYGLAGMETAGGTEDYTKWRWSVTWEGL